MEKFDNVLEESVNDTGEANGVLFNALTWICVGIHLPLIYVGLYCTYYCNVLSCELISALYFNFYFRGLVVKRRNSHS